MFPFVTNLGPSGLRGFGSAGPGHFATRAVADRRGSFRLKGLTAFPAKRSVFHFEVAAISTLDLHHFLRPRRIGSYGVGCPSGGGEGLLHIRLKSVGRHPRPAPHGAPGLAHHGGRERAAEHRPSETDQGEAESPDREGEIPASGADEPGDIVAVIRRRLM